MITDVIDVHDSGDPQDHAVRLFGLDELDDHHPLRYWVEGLLAGAFRTKQEAITAGRKIIDLLRG